MSVCVVAEGGPATEHLLMLGCTLSFQDLLPCCAILVGGEVWLLAVGALCCCCSSFLVCPYAILCVVVLGADSALGWEGVVSFVVANILAVEAP